MRDRVERVQALLHNRLAALVHKDIQFPEGALVTITRVQVSKDLAFANVYVSVLPQERFKEVLSLLDADIFQIQQTMNKELHMKIVPKIRFCEDQEFVHAGKIEELLEKIKKER